MYLRFSRRKEVEFVLSFDVVLTRVSGYKSFGETYCLHLQGWNVWRHVDLKVDTNVSEKHTVSIFSSEDGDSMFLRNVEIYLWVPTASQPRRTTYTLEGVYLLLPSLFILNFLFIFICLLHIFYTHPSLLYPLLFLLCLHFLLSFLICRVCVRRLEGSQFLYTIYILFYSRK
jgi:hypothetical protein